MAGERKGVDALLQVETSSGTYETVGGVETHSFSSNVGIIEITNYGTNENKEYLPGAGVANTTVSLSGSVTNTASFNLIESSHRAKSPVGIRLWFDDANPAIYTGNFMVPTLEFSSSHDGKLEYSITLESQGAITKS